MPRQGIIDTLQNGDNVTCGGNGPAPLKSLAGPTGRNQSGSWCIAASAPFDLSNKGVANIYHFERVARSGNGRSLEALSVIDAPAPSYQPAERLAERKVVAQRSCAGFNPARGEDIRLFQAILQGDQLLHGFRNQDIRNQLYDPVHNSHVRRRQANSVGRRLKRLHVRGLIAKIPRTRRWRVTSTGHTLLGSVLRLHYYGLAQAA